MVFGLRCLDFEPPLYLHDIDKSKFFQDALIDSLKTLERGNHLIVVCFPLLTRKYVGLFNFFGQNFEEVGFVRPHFGRDAIFFSEFRGLDSNLSEKLSEIREACLKDALDEQKVVELIPISELVVEPLYSLIFGHNFNVLRARGITLLNKVDSETECETV